MYDRARLVNYREFKATVNGSTLLVVGGSSKLTVICMFNLTLKR